MRRRAAAIALLFVTLAVVLAAPMALAETIQDGVLRISVDGSLSPQKLSRHGGTPIAVAVGWKIAITDGSPPPTLKSVRHSFLTAGCPAPAGFGGAVFPFARISFEFLGGQNRSLTLTRNCKARGR